MMSTSTAFFFSGCKNPFNVSDIITCLAAGRQLNSAELPPDVLPSVVLLATIGLRKYEQQIVDDYIILLDRMEEIFKDKTLWHGDFYHPNLNLVSAICREGPRAEFFLDELFDAQYMFTVYEELINADTDNLFSWLGSASEQESEVQEAPSSDGPKESASRKAAQRGTARGTRRKAAVK